MMSIKTTPDNIFQAAMNDYRNQNLLAAFDKLNYLAQENIASFSNQYDLYLYLGIIKQKQHDFIYAKNFYEQALKIQDTSPLLLNNYANTLKNLGKDIEAENYFQKALQEDPKYSLAYYNYGNLLLKLERIAQAEQCYEKAIQFQRDFFLAYQKLVTLLIQQKYFSAITALTKKILTENSLKPNELFQMGVLLHQHNYLSFAISFYQRAIELGFKDLTIYVNLAIAKHLHGENKETVLACYQHALQINPKHASIYVNMGFSLYRFFDFENALIALNTAITLDPTIPEAYYNIGMIYHDLKDYSSSMAAFQKAMDCDSNYQSARIMLINAAQHNADWAISSEHIAKLIPQLEAAVANKHAISVSPFAALMLPLSNALQSAIAIQSAETYKNTLNFPKRTFKNSVRKINIGYISADFTIYHPVGLLINTIFKYHDRAQFNVYGYGLRTFPAQDSKHIEQSFDKFTLLGNASDEEASQIIYDDCIDILIDVSGYTKHSRLGILANKPAPIQCHFLGTTNTLGAEYIDYYLATNTMVPSTLQQYFSEKVLYLPDSYIATEPFEIPPQSITRNNYNLPEDACVFCCFNTVQRIDEGVFSVWMKILNATNNSVLWLQEENPHMRKNLIAYAKQCYVDPSRLVFSKPEGMTVHWRHRLADLWLDTFILSAGTAGILCAYAGLPMLTLAGKTPHARTGAGICASIGMQELVVESVDGYISKAIELGNNLTYLRNLKQNLLSHRDSYTLFNPKRFIHQLEQVLLSVL